VVPGSLGDHARAGLMAHRGQQLAYDDGPVGAACRHPLVEPLLHRADDLLEGQVALEVLLGGVPHLGVNHPVVGELELSYEVMELPADSGLNISVYSAEPGSRSQEALDLLASWAATPLAPSPLDGSTNT